MRKYEKNYDEENETEKIRKAGERKIRGKKYEGKQTVCSRAKDFTPP